MIRLLLALALAYLVGAVPVGYWLARARGLEPRRIAPYNIGLENFLRLVGNRRATLGFTTDLLKGALAVWVASPLPPDAALLAGLAAYVGHLYPPSQFFPAHARDVWPVRGRGNVLLLGVLTGLAALRDLPFALAAFPVVVWAATLAWTRLVALATAAGALAMVLGIAVSPVGASGRLAAFTLLALVLWRNKENLGRILDLTEPRLGETLPVAGERPDHAVAAFLFHGLYPEDIFKTRRTAWLKPLVDRRILSLSAVHGLARILLRPFKIGELRGMYTLDGKEIRCHLLVAGMMPDDFRRFPGLAVRRAIQGARLAHELGASTVGLGAFFGTVGRKGLDVQAAVPEIHVTNGGAYTAGTVRAAIPAILANARAHGLRARDLRAAVVGANGVVAFGMARQIAPDVGHVTLVGRDLARLERSRRTLESAFPTTTFSVSTSARDCRDADVVLTATSDPDYVVLPGDVKPGAWVYDEGRPADVHPEVADVPGVRLIPGGVVQPPGGMRAENGWATGTLGFGSGRVPACLAETLIIAANEAWDRASLGEVTRSEDIAYFVEQAERLGFRVIDEPDPSPAAARERELSLAGH